MIETEVILEKEFENKRKVKDSVLLGVDNTVHSIKRRIEPRFSEFLEKNGIRVLIEEKIRSVRDTYVNGIKLIPNSNDRRTFSFISEDIDEAKKNYREKVKPWIENIGNKISFHKCRKMETIREEYLALGEICKI